MEIAEGLHVCRCPDVFVYMLERPLSRVGDTFCSHVLHACCIVAIALCMRGGLEFHLSMSSHLTLMQPACARVPLHEKDGEISTCSTCSPNFDLQYLEKRYSPHNLKNIGRMLQSIV